LIGQFHWQWGVAVLAIGSVSALMGILYAMMQHDLKRLLAYSSVENIGVIFMGLGMALLFLAEDRALLGAIALVAALYHTLNHAVFKALLFFGAGAITHSANERDLDKMGGLLRRMPWTGFFFLIGCISISGLPTFNGFVSEWLTFQAALQAWRLDSGVLRSTVPIAAAILALTCALAAACFVKVYAVAFLGQARSRHVRRARQVPRSMRAGQAILALLCFLLGVFPTNLIELINSVPLQLLGQGLQRATAHGWLWLTPLSAHTASYSAPWLTTALFVAVAVGFWLFGRGLRRVQRCPAWDCGFGSPGPSMQYTATAFAQPIRRVFAMLFRIDEHVEAQHDGRLRHRLQISDRAWEIFYLPVINIVEKAARRVVRLQSGNVRIYLGWSLATLLLLLWIMA
jgi:NADH:ubiquinone oxidoreductase subunit 5 (subunit L)/multisubunit Na+/H+ antiporter MnhA subunit